ncbi:flagellar brake domain-containing protein [PVC group bacterium]|nr:flagellar brake domain-containing protein [PVC group bacterium]
MPAQRSRTSGWRRCLQQLVDHHGSLQIALAPAGSTGSDFVWRAKLIGLTETEILVEMPTAAGEPLPLTKGVQLLGIMAIGQNRWMCRTSCVGTTKVRSRGRDIVGLKLAMPSTMERCQRRRDFRISTDTLLLPEVSVWPLLDPRSVVLAERLCQLRIERSLSGNNEPESIEGKDAIPDVGPLFPATLVNIGGGGVGLQIAGSETSSIGRHRLYWLRFPLPGVDSPPLCVTAKQMHWHLEAGGSMYIGMAFDFSFNPSHRRFVVQQITQAVAIQQREQFRSSA